MSQQENSKKIVKKLLTKRKSLYIIDIQKKQKRRKKIKKATNESLEAVRERKRERERERE